MSLLRLVASQTLRSPRNHSHAAFLLQAHLLQHHDLLIIQQNKHECRRPLMLAHEGWPMPKPFSGSYISSAYIP